MILHVSIAQLYYIYSNPTAIIEYRLFAVHAGLTQQLFLVKCSSEYLIALVLQERALHNLKNLGFRGCYILNGYRLMLKCLFNRASLIEIEYFEIYVMF